MNKMDIINDRKLPFLLMLIAKLTSWVCLATHLQTSVSFHEHSHNVVNFSNVSGTSTTEISVEMMIIWAVVQKASSSWC